LFVYILNIAI